MKKCIKCKESKEKTEFTKRSSSKDGLRSWCKMCSSKSIKKWREKNRTHIKNYDNEYKEKNKENIKKKKKEYREKNREKIKIYNKEYKEKNKAHIKKMTKEYRVRNREKIKTYSKVKGKEYRGENKVKIKFYLKEYRAKHKNKISENQKLRRLKHLKKNPNYYKKYHIENQKIILQKSKEYYYNNQEAKKKYSRNYAKTHRKKINKRISIRYKTDIQFHLYKKLKTYFYMSFKNNSKKGRMVDCLGMTIVEFKKYLESNFEDWMTWDNIGLYNGDFNFGWDIDHIKPLSLFDLTKEEHVRQAWHYTNLQPLCSKVNREIKRDKYPFINNQEI